MIQLAVEGREGFEASDIEVLRGGTTYTVDTLTHLKATRPGDRSYILSVRIRCS
jgi:nicotinate-nucleotide adenylyltransferase